MTQEEIEGNKLIGYYMGATIIDIPGIQKTIMYPVNGGEAKFVTRLRYNKSMDWLYPVYQKIYEFVRSRQCEELDSYTKMLLRVKAIDCSITIEQGKPISEIFKEIVEWIKIYNSKVLEDGKDITKS